jgi:CheY-like chemotaxis protein
VPSVPIILFIENDVGDAALCMSALIEQEKARLFKSVFVRSGPEALDFLDAATELPHAIVLDLIMPTMHGIEVISTIRASKTLHNIPIVALSSGREQSDIDECYRRGANAYVVKPIGFKEFDLTIQTIALFWGRMNIASGIIGKAKV